MKRRLISFTLVLMLILTMVAGSTVALAETTTGATVTNGWDIEKTHYYENGQMVKGFKTIGGYKYYFGADGAAYKAPEEECEYVKCCLVKSINGVYYGFDGNGRVVTGLWADINGKGWIFKNDGAQNVTKTKKLRKMLKSKKASKKLLKNVKKLLGKPKKTKIGKNSCNKFGTRREKRRDKFWDYTLRYKNVDIELVKNKRTGKYRMNGIFGKDIY